VSEWVSEWVTDWLTDWLTDSLTQFWNMQTMYKHRTISDNYRNTIFWNMQMMYNLKILKVFIKFWILKGIKCDSENIRYSRLGVFFCLVW
jgi:hypothetical protein